MLRKIDISTYDVAGGNKWDCRQSLVELLFAEPKLAPREILRRDELARRIEQLEGTSLVLEDEDYRRITSAMNAVDFKPYGRAAVEFIRRVLEAPQVELPKG